jgi:hypothetical protein
MDGCCCLSHLRKKFFVLFYSLFHTLFCLNKCSGIPALKKNNLFGKSWLKRTEKRHVQKKLRNIQIFQEDYEKVEGVKTRHSKTSV